MCYIVLEFEKRIQNQVRKINREIDKVTHIMLTDILNVNAFSLFEGRDLSIFELSKKEIERLKCSFEKKIKDRGKINTDKWRIANNFNTPTNFSLLISQSIEENVSNIIIILDTLLSIFKRI